MISHQPLVLFALPLLQLTCQTSCGVPPDDWRGKLPEPVVEAHPGWVALYYAAWRIADVKMSKYADQFMFDTAFTKGRIWMWDTVWISHFGVYVQDANPRITNPMHGHDLFYGVQRADGCIPHVWDATGSHDWGVHNPIFTLGELNAYRHTGDKSRLLRALPVLDRFYFYLKGKYRTPDGLYRSFDWNNGMDNRPSPGVSIDSTCEQAMVAGHLKEISEIVGDKERATRFGDEHLSLKKLINDRMWYQGDNFYVDCNNQGQPDNVWSVASYWALLSKVAPAERAKQMRDHLFDPANFKTPMMVPTLGRKSSAYDGKGGGYWKGAVWIPTNTMVIKGLLEYGYLAEAREIAINGLDGMFQTWKRTGTLFENYDQEQPGFPGGNSKADFVGWSGVQPIATLLETIIGIRTHAPENTIRWTLRLTEKHGVRRLKWGPNYGKQVDLIADARNAPGDAVMIHVTTNSPFTLEVDTGFATRTFVIKEAGGKTFTIPKR